ncbi:hypothetical protein INS49_007244 [Diaporthe citri]|uniref:uncharacterized protein n=1 Tax=Diaporthe citri TaxID=83186 RepID=UPI001C812AA7|nr:uncharacterized protein INS49_007244 [Diaporthe citri]KAG6365633.1 hypothetical protein INS49_007244 [Diaporthe citri]
MAQDTQAVAITQLGQEKTDFPLLRLPAEIRNRIYSETLHEDLVVQLLLEPQPDLLRTNKQIRSEALPIYYGVNQFFVTIHGPDGPYSLFRIPSVVRPFVRDVPTSIKAHIRHIIIHIDYHHRPQKYDHVLELTDGSHRPIPASYRVGEPGADWTNYVSARMVFNSNLVDMPVKLLPFLEAGDHVYSKGCQPPLSLSEATWLLARTFIASAKSVYIDAWRHKDLDLVYELSRLNREGLDV